MNCLVFLYIITIIAVITKAEHSASLYTVSNRTSWTFSIVA